MYRTSAELAGSDWLRAEREGVGGAGKGGGGGEPGGGWELGGG